ncbi:SusC/RagA family TonB-linked outer membrane protein [Aestuariibaculum marinum]|uniref:TonB-dependent receptor n=1 Tax=Aestuariibaculum marinum TaxID=2683592 RepID=A0A8J6U7U0_9FLAO|nr:TonB-dependent receptor [Aestuariibaculum marinum]MBD0825464.1 TonB-dependent receptor [Aestuariibaculum marinum]
MRTFIFFCCTLVFGFSPNNVVSQNSKIIIKEDKTLTVDEVFDLIMDQTEYDFFYEEGIFNNYPKVNLKKGVIKTNKLLSDVLSYGELQVTIQTNNTIVIKGNLSKSNKAILQTAISGTVTDESGQPLPGASVVEKGTTNGVQTNFDGEFSLNLKGDDAILVVTFLGYETQEIAVGNQTVIDVLLKESVSSLDEVVIVGFGSTKKENLTAAVDQISGDELGNRANTSIVQSLQGVMPGLNIQSNNGDPRENPEINVRGFNSINGGSPLVLIDGIAGNINLLNPSDIESVTVLKDAGSAAIYGARGAFGVILVTTKKGKEGAVKVYYNSTLSMASPAVRTDYISDPVLYGKTIDSAIYGYNGSNYTGYTNEQDWERLQLVADGVYAPWQELQADGTFKFYGSTDWYDYLYRKQVFSQINDVSISGGNETIQGYLSGRLYKTGTVQKLQDEEVTRKNIKANLSFKVNDWLKLSNDVQYNTGDQIEYGGRTAGWGLSWTYDNNYLFAFDSPEIEGVSFDRRGQGTFASVKAGKSYQDYDYKQLVNTFSAIITPLDNLKVNIDYSNRFTNNNWSRRLNPFEYLTGERLDLQTVGLNRLTEQKTENVYNVLNAYATFDQTIADNHNFKLTTGYNQEDFNEEVVIAEQGGLFDPDYSNLNLGTEILRADAEATNWAVQGVFGRFHYDFSNKYLLDITARYDGSSRFPENSRWGFFPSASAAWFLSRENFWENIKPTISSFKLRGSYGVLGNQSVGLYTFSQLLPIGTTDWLVGGSKLNMVGDPNPLPSSSTWENTAITNFGVDLGFFNNKFTTSVDVYRKQVTDMYLPGEPLPGVFGANEPRENNADLEVKGFELALTYQNTFTLKGKPLTLKVTGSLNNSVGKITKYSNPNGLLSSFYEGQTLGEIWGYRTEGQFQSNEEALAYQNTFVNPSLYLSDVYNYAFNVTQNSDYRGLIAGDVKYLDLDGDGKIDNGNNTLEDHGDLRVIGNGMPKFPFGFLISSEWNGFDVLVQGAGVASQDWYPRGRMYWGTYERPYVAYIRKDLVSNAWSEDNPNGRYPQIGRGYSALGSDRQLSVVNDYYLENLGYLRLKNLTVGYTLPQDITRKISIERLRVYFSGENLFTFRFGGLTKYLDPEQAGSGVSLSNPNNATTSSDVEDYPINKMISLGINITL